MVSFRVVPALFVLAATAPAQSTGVIDEATFTFLRAGRPYGTESFKIVRWLGTDGIEYTAQGTRVINGKIVKTSLSTDSTGAATNYLRQTTGAAQVTARRSLNRLTVEDAADASSRDYMFAPGTVLLDDDVIHQLYFVTWRAAQSLRFIVPSTRTTGLGPVTALGPENVTVGGNTVAAEKFSFGTGAAMREIWVDSERRLLKVSHPASQTVGTRNHLPR